MGPLSEREQRKKRASTRLARLLRERYAWCLSNAAALLKHYFAHPQLAKAKKAYTRTPEAFG